MMIASLRSAFRIGAAPKLALVGAGGKTTAMFTLAGEFLPPVLVTTTTHLGREQAVLADRHFQPISPQMLEEIEAEWPKKTLLLTGSPIQDGERLQGLAPAMLERVRSLAERRGVPLLIEADGSRRLPLKAPSENEPVIPQFVDGVILVAGLQGLYRPLDEQTVHRPELFAKLSGLRQGELIRIEGLERLLRHSQGGLKNIPDGARRMALLNGADSPELQMEGRCLAEHLLEDFDAAAVVSLNKGGVKTPPETAVWGVFEPVAGVILAAGGGERMGGGAKLLLPWRGEPIVRTTARTAIEAGLRPVVVVTGAHTEELEAALAGLQVDIVYNQEWQTGQSSSVRVGVEALPEKTGAAIFLLGDQPQTPVELIKALRDEHASNLSPVVAPIVKGQRANPVLFDRVTFPDLLALHGDAGGRQVFERFGVHPLLWNDERQLWDVDTPADYEKLIGM